MSGILGAPSWLLVPVNACLRLILAVLSRHLALVVCANRVDRGLLLVFKEFSVLFPGCSGRLRLLVVDMSGPPSFLYRQVH